MVGGVTELSNTALIEKDQGQSAEQGVLDQAISIIDKELGHLAAREMVSATELTNVLLDLRLLLSPAAPQTAASAETVPA